MHPQAEYQFCGHGLHREMIECKTCKRIIEREDMRLGDEEESARIEKGCAAVKKRVEDIITTAKGIIDALEREARRRHDKKRSTGRS